MAAPQRTLRARQTAAFETAIRGAARPLLTDRGFDVGRPNFPASGTPFAVGNDAPRPRFSRTLNENARLGGGVLISGVWVFLVLLIPA